MKYVKSLGLLFSITVAALALAAPASATTLTSSAGTTPTTAWTMTSTELHGSFTTVKCGHFHWHQQATTHGFLVKWHTTTLSWTNCNYPVTVQAGGVVSAESAATTGNGTLRSEGMQITVHTSVGQCVFTTNGTDIGTLTGSNITGGNARVDINSAAIPRTGGSFLCGSTATWTGNATITTPSSLEVH